MLGKIALAVFAISTAAHADPYLRREMYGLGLTAPLTVPRSEFASDGSLDPTCTGYGSAPCPGVGLWSISKMYDAKGDLVPFCIGRPRTLVCGGRLLIRHRGLVLPGYGDSYPIYAHATLHMLGPYPTEDAMPAKDWTHPDPAVMLDGQNINGVKDHYYNAKLAYSVRLSAPGCYRVSVMAGAGTDAAPKRDDLAELPSYGQQNTEQFWCQVQ